MFSAAGATFFIMSEEKKRTPARNDITGAYIESKPPTEEYRKGWERIFGKKKDENPPKVDKPKNKWVH